MQVYSVVVLAAVVAVTGCSGGAEDKSIPAGSSGPPGSSSSQSQGCGQKSAADVVPLRCSDLVTNAPVAGLDALPGGIWWGQFVDESQDVQGYLLGISAEDGRFQFYASRQNQNDTCVNWAAMMAGKMTTSGNNFSGNGRVYAMLPSLLNGASASYLTVEGVVEERDSLTGSWNANSGDSGCFQLEYGNSWEYEAPSSLAHLVGEWNDRAVNDKTEITIAADGSLSGSDPSGCSWAGYFAVVDDRYSVYEFDAELQSCSRAGRYRGLAWYGDGWDPGEYWLRLHADDGKQAIRYTFSNY